MLKFLRKKIKAPDEYRVPAKYRMLSRKNIVILFIVILVCFYGVHLVLNTDNSENYCHDLGNAEEYTLKNGLQLYLSYESILGIMGEPDNIEEYSIGDGSLYPVHYYYILYYNGLKISMLYIDEENSGEADIERSRAEQIQIFSSDYYTSRNIAVGQTAKKLKRAYNFNSSLKISRIYESRIGNVFTKDMEAGYFNKYDSLCYVATSTDIYEDRETKGLLFLIKSDEISSIVIFNPRPLVMTPTLN